MGKIRVVAVDGGGVLCGAVPEPMLKMIASRYPPDVAKTIIGLHKANPAAWNRVKADINFSEAEYYNTLFKGAPIKETPEEIGVVLRESLDVFSDIFDMLKDIKSKGMDVGIVTNHTTWWFDYIIKKWNLLSVLKRDMILVSQEINCYKPMPEIYQCLYDRILANVGKDVQKNEVVFVDDKEENVKAAIHFGFAGITFNRHKQPASLLRQQLKQIGVDI